MNVLFVSQIVPYPPHGGVLQRGYNIIKELGKYNDVYLLAFTHPDILSSDELVEESKKSLGEYCEIVEYFSLWPKKSTIHKLAGFFLGFFLDIPFSVFAHKSRSLKKRIDEVIEKNDIDLIHFDTIALAQYFNVRHNLPAILTHHNIESELMSRRASVEKNPIARLYLSREVKKLIKYEKSQCGLFDVNIVMSEIDGMKLLEFSNNVVTSVIPNGADLEYFVPIIGLETNAVIYTGGMNMYANADAVTYFIKQIWPLIKEKCTDAIFYVIGQDPTKEIIEIAKSDSSIKVLGYVDDVRPYVAKAAVYVVPLRVGGGTRLKVLDALSQGKAIVSTSLGCEGIVVTDQENIVIADSPDDFAREVLHLFNDVPRRRKLGEHGRQLAVKKYGWEAIGKQLQAAYQMAKDKKSQRL